VRLTRDDAGSRRTVPAGELIEVAFPETAATGYRWQLDEAGDFEFVDEQRSGPALPRGAPGRHVLTVRPRRAGPIQLRLIKRRSWESAAAEEFVIDLDVEPV
jgi:predicted secreted protein